MNVSVFLVTNWPFLFSLSQIFLVKTSKGLVIIYRHGGAGDFGGWDHLIFKRTNGGSLKTLEGFREGTTQIFLENEDMVGGGRGGGMGGRGESRKSSNVIQWSKIQRGDRLNFTLFSPKSSTLSPLPPQAINNDRSLSEALLWRLFGIELFAFFFP